MSALNNVKKFGLAMLVGLALPFLIFLSLFLATWGDYQVPPTVLQAGDLPRIQLNQNTFHSESHGDPGAPLVLVLHDGPGGDYRSLLPLKALADEYHVVFYDQRGSGLSLRVPREQLTIEQALKDVEAFVEHWSPERPAMLIGHGWGGMLASAYTGRHPERVARLSLLEPGFLNTEMANLILPAMSKSTASFIGQASMAWVASLHISGPDPAAAQDYVLGQIRPKAFQYCGEIPEDVEQRHWRAGFDAWKAITQSTFDSRGQVSLDFTEGLKDFEAPVQILASSCNRLMGREFQARQRQLFAQAEMATVKQSGHDLLLDNPQESLALIRHYLKSGEARLRGQS